MERMFYGYFPGFPATFLRFKPENSFNMVSQIIKMSENDSKLCEVRDYLPVFITN